MERERNASGWSYALRPHSYFAAGRTELNIFQLSLFPLISQRIPAISLACCACMNRNAIARTHTWKTMLPARCNLRAAALRHTLPQAAAQAAARKFQRPGRMVFHVCVRAIAFMFILHTQHASEIAGNSVISGNTEKVEICSTRCGLRLAACGLRPAACGKVWTNQANSLILLFERMATRGKVRTGQSRLKE